MGDKSASWEPHRYGGGCRLDLGALAIDIEWSTTKGKGFVVRLPYGRTVEGFGSDLEAAKQHAERWLRRALTRALALLGDRGNQ